MFTTVPSVDDMNRSPESLSVHPGYMHFDADLKIISSDGVVFYAHSVILRLASPVFSDMLSMPREYDSDEGMKQGSEARDKEAVKLTESEDIVAALLDSIYPRRPKPELDSFDFVQRLAIAADKYDISDVTNTIRGIICSQAAASNFGSPLCNYSLACRLNWIEEARSLSFMALSANIDSPNTLEVMDTIEPRWMLKFLNFRRRRYTIFRDALNIHYDTNAPDERRIVKLRWEIVAMTHVPSCRSQAHNKTNWNAFKMYILSAFDGDTTGNGLGESSSSFWIQDRLNPIINESCSKCSEPFFSKFGLSLEVRRIIDEVLPKQIE